MVKKLSPQIIRLITLFCIIIFFFIYLFNSKDPDHATNINQHTKSPDFIKLKERYTKDIQFFSADDMRGREPGSPEMKKIAAYVKKKFRAHGVLPLDSSYTQEVFIPSSGKSCHNILGYLKGSDATLSREFIMLSAHYDHLGIAEKSILGDSIYNGARDNAIGISAVLQSAIYFSKNPVKRSLLFVLFTGEELGFVGSKYMANNLPIDKSALVFMLNTDGAGYNDKSVVNIVGLKHTNMLRQITESVNSIGLGVLGDPTKDQDLFERSDNISFVYKGIPAVTMSAGFHSFDKEIEKHYHKVTDESDTLDFEYLTLWLKAYIFSAVTLGNSSIKPNWENPTFYQQYTER